MPANTVEMTFSLSPVTPRTARDFAVFIIQRLSSFGHKAYLVGGCVRDELLGGTPKDYDVATDATPTQIIDMFGHLPHSTIKTVGAHFGVVLVKWAYGLEVFTIEVATFRSDHAYQDGRRPTGITFETNAAADAIRRDFTINALFMDVMNDNAIIDYVGGLHDIRTRTIRAIGDPYRRFAEDHLRILRAPRFASRLNFRIADSTAEAIVNLKAKIQEVAIERVREEITKIVTQPGLHAARIGLEYLFDLGLLSQIIPEWPEDEQYFSVVCRMMSLFFTGPFLNSPNEVEPRVPVIMSIILHGFSAEQAGNIMVRLKFTNQEIIDTVSLVAQQSAFNKADEMLPAPQKRLLRQEDVHDHLLLHFIRNIVLNGCSGHYFELSSIVKNTPFLDFHPVPAITGADLIESGRKPGPVFKEILTAVEDGQLDGTITTKEQAWELVERVWPNV